MRIAWLTYSFLEYSAFHVNELSLQHDVLFVVPSEPTVLTDDAVADRVEWFAFHKPRFRQPIKQIAKIREILHRIDEFQPDVVHVQQGHLWFNFVLGRLRRRYPLVITIHDPRHHLGDKASKKTPQWVMDLGFRQADQVIVHGQQLKDQVVSLFGFSQSSVHVIPHISMGGEPELAAELNTEQPVEDLIVLFFGRIWDYKGLEYLIQAQPIIRESIPNAKVLIAGTGDDFARYEAMMQDHDGFIVHNHWISNEQRDALFRRAALVVLPYREATQSGVVPVAYGYSKPVVASDVGALSECVAHEETGLLVPSCDSNALAQAIIRLLKDEPLRRRYGQAGYQRLQQLSSPACVAAETANVYQQAIAQRAKAGEV
ncbi:MAG: glycosyltransferase family 4 protein [Planctomycetales bacterium]|nr:glycosyltransferase family 4 protein [Planctomycetales bacterium]